MMYLHLISLISSWALTAASPLSACYFGTPQTRSGFVDLGYAKYQGTHLSAGINQYLSMRYAAPPLGDLRWKAPADPPVTTGVQDASKFGPICIGLLQPYISALFSEDCLFINIWAPADATPSSRLPVWFFIQGGGYITNSNANYNGTKVVQESGGNIILVNFNYRVSAYGFLASERVRSDGDLNVGLLDQRKALEWVQRYISLFGGDPNHVVMHGVSSGAGSVALHLTAYGGRNDGLFVGAIGESMFFPTQPQVGELEFQFERFVNDVGCAGAGNQMACLRSKDTLTLQKGNHRSPYPNATDPATFYFTPCIDGQFVEDYPIDLLEKGKFVNVPIIIGDDTNEGSLFAANAGSPEAVASFMVSQYPHLTGTQTGAINAQYPLTSPLPHHAPYFPSLSAAYGESAFTCPSITVLQSFAKYLPPNQTWSYRVNIQDINNLAGGIGVPHTFELPTIFGPGCVNDRPGTSFSTYNAPIVPVIMNYWISFIRALNPNHHKLATAPNWTPYTHAQRRLVLQTNHTAMEAVPLDQLSRCDFWHSLHSTLEI